MVSSIVNDWMSSVKTKSTMSHKRLVGNYWKLLRVMNSKRLLIWCVHISLPTSTTCTFPFLLVNFRPIKTDNQVLEHLEQEKRNFDSRQYCKNKMSQPIQMIPFLLTKQRNKTIKNEIRERICYINIKFLFPGKWRMDWEERECFPMLNETQWQDVKRAEKWILLTSWHLDEKTHTCV